MTESGSGVMQQGGKRQPGAECWPREWHDLSMNCVARLSYSTVTKAFYYFSEIINAVKTCSMKFTLDAFLSV